MSDQFALPAHIKLVAGAQWNPLVEYLRVNYSKDENDISDFISATWRVHGRLATRDSKTRPGVKIWLTYRSDTDEWSIYDDFPEFRFEE